MNSSRLLKLRDPEFLASQSRRLLPIRIDDKLAVNNLA
jgi:hypothetical protein